jgi:hypothetical protein
MKHVIAALILCLTLALTPPARASGGVGVSWNFHDLTGVAAGNSALAMRGGEAWPVVFTDSGGSVRAYSLFPATGTTSHWVEIGSFGGGPATNLNAATSPDGRVAAAWNSGFGIGQVSGLPSGWTPLPPDTRAVAFDDNGNLITATNGSVSVGGYAGPTGIRSIATSPLGDVGVAAGSTTYSQYSPWIGWRTFNFGTPINAVTIDSVGRPHVASSSAIFDFNPITGQWSQGLSVTTSNGIVLASSDDGSAGAAWSNAGTLFYAHKPDGGAWSVNTVATGVFNSSHTIGLAFDYNDLPVISYGGSSGMRVAYDPIVLPEPASVSLLALGVGTLMLRRRR